MQTVWGLDVRENIWISVDGRGNFNGSIKVKVTRKK